MECAQGGDRECIVEEPGLFTRTKFKEVLSALHKIAGKWTDVVDARNLEFKPLKGAMTNHIYECHWPGVEGDQQRKVLLRIYGESVNILFKREDEVATFELLSKKGQGPQLLGRIPNGRIEEFIHARTLSAGDLRNPRTSANIAGKLWEFHQLKLPAECKPMLWTRLRNWSKKAGEYPSGADFCLPKIEKEIDELESKISKSSDLIGFCHNDLQYGNIMLDDADESLTIIDYEYATYNPVAFDIANHFCEMAADYHTETPHLMDYSKYPDSAERQRFIEAYLNESGRFVEQSEIQELMKQTDRYELASHIHWGLWGIISAAISDIEFDFLGYAKQRFQRYYERKSVCLSDSTADDCVSISLSKTGTGTD